MLTYQTGNTCGLFRAPKFVASTAPSAAASRDRTLYGTGLGHRAQRHALGLTRQQL